MAKEAIFIFGAIAAGIAVAGSIFLLYPDLMFQNTGFETQGGEGTDVPVFVDETNTAGAGSNSTNSTSNATSGSSSATAPPS
jgi:hypothetical protein